MGDERVPLHLPESDASRSFSSLSVDQKATSNFRLLE